MTDPAGGPPPPQGSVPPPGAVPPPPGAVAPPQAAGSWQAPPPTAAPGGFQTQAVAAEPGPAPGVAYADLMNRIIALVIDAVILGVINFLFVILAGILAVAGMGLLIGLFFGVIWAGINLVYFVYGWTRMRASYGQKFLNLETVNAADGATLTQNQAIRRWAFLWGPWALGVAIPILGWLISFLAFFYALYLLYTASQSPKRQGFHDVQSGTVVVKRVA